MPSRFDDRLDQHGRYIKAHGESLNIDHKKLMDHQAEIDSLRLHVNDLLEQVRVLESKQENMNRWMATKMVEAIDEIVKKELGPKAIEEVREYAKNQLHNAIVYQLHRWDEWKPKYFRIGRLVFTWEKKREAQ